MHNRSSQNISLSDLIENDVQPNPEQTIVIDTPEQTIGIDDPEQKLERKRKREKEFQEAKALYKASSKDPEKREAARQKLEKLRQEKELAKKEASLRIKDKKRIANKNGDNTLEKKRVKKNAKKAAENAVINGYPQSRYLEWQSDLYKKEFEKARKEKEEGTTQEMRDTHSGKTAGREHARLNLSLSADFHGRSKEYKDAFNIEFDSFDRDEHDYNSGFKAGRQAANLGYKKSYNLTDDQNSIKDKSKAYIEGYNAGYDAVTISPSRVAYNRGKKAAYADGTSGIERTIFDNIIDPIITQHLDEYIRGYKEIFTKKKPVTSEERENSQASHTVTQTQTKVSSEVVDYTQTTVSSETDAGNDNLLLAQSSKSTDAGLLASQGIFAQTDKDLTTSTVKDQKDTLAP